MRLIIAGAESSSSIEGTSEAAGIGERTECEEANQSDSAVYTSSCEST